MTLSRKRKASLGLLAVALSALAADRLLLGGGSPATASAAAGVPLAGPEGIPAPAPVPSGPGLASRLKAIAEAEGLDPVQVEDLFAEEAEVVPLVLTATLGTGQRAAVMVNGKQLRVGQRLAGAVLLEVTREGALFARDGEEFFVELPRPSADFQTSPSPENAGGA